MQSLLNIFWKEVCLTDDSEFEFELISTYEKNPLTTGSGKRVAPSLWQELL